MTLTRLKFDDVMLLWTKTLEKKVFDLDHELYLELANIFYDPLKIVFHCSLANPKVIFTRSIGSEEDEETSNSLEDIEDQDTVEMIDTFDDDKESAEREDRQLVFRRPLRPR